ncbi:MAG: hypothetical protein PHS37_08995, partial [Candidatus Omnitrophica bacterium]|nr:hypothetical protein [Candidatus Omnitrophota bacterium]
SLSTVDTEKTLYIIELVGGLAALARDPVARENALIYLGQGAGMGAADALKALENMITDGDVPLDLRVEAATKLGKLLTSSPVSPSAQTRIREAVLRIMNGDDEHGPVLLPAPVAKTLVRQVARNWFHIMLIEMAFGPNAPADIFKEHLAGLGGTATPTREIGIDMGTTLKKMARKYGKAKNAAGENIFMRKLVELINAAGPEGKQLIAACVLDEWYGIFNHVADDRAVILKTIDHQVLNGQIGDYSTDRVFRALMDDTKVQAMELKQSIYRGYIRRISESLPVTSRVFDSTSVPAWALGSYKLPWKAFARLMDEHFTEIHGTKAESGKALGIGLGYLYKIIEKRPVVAANYFAELRNTLPGFMSHCRWPERPYVIFITAKDFTNVADLFGLTRAARDGLGEHRFRNLHFYVVEEGNAEQLRRRIDSSKKVFRENPDAAGIAFLGGDLVQKASGMTGMDDVMKRLIFVNTQYPENGCYSVAALIVLGMGLVDYRFNNDGKRGSADNIVVPLLKLIAAVTGRQWTREDLDQLVSGKRTLVLPAIEKIDWDAWKDSYLKQDKELAMAA